MCPDYHTDTYRTPSHQGLHGDQSLDDIFFHQHISLQFSTPDTWMMRNPCSHPFHRDWNEYHNCNPMDLQSELYQKRTVHIYEDSLQESRLFQESLQRLPAHPHECIHLQKLYILLPLTERMKLTRQVLWNPHNLSHRSPSLIADWMNLQHEQDASQ